MNKRALFVATSLIGVGIVFGVVLMTSFGSNAIQNLFAAGGDLGAKQAPSTAPATVQALNAQFVAVSEAVTRSVVSISVKVDRSRRESPFPEGLFQFPPRGSDEDAELYMPESAGSGVVVSADGYIVTNNHVVENAAENGIRVTTSEQREYKARLIGRDPLTDLAVLKVDGATLTPVHFGERRDIRIGEWVIAVGNPLGLKSTVTTGIVSAMGRGIGIIGTNDRNTTRNRLAVENFIQTDAAINPGNSGGGLFNLNGSLVGINTAIASATGRNEGYGFAIPIDMVRSVALDLIDDGKIQRGYIGVEISSVDETSAKASGLSTISGVVISKVVRGGAAEGAGLEIGDVILEVDGTPIKTSNELQNQIVIRRAGDKVNLKIWRDKREVMKSVTLKSLDGDDDVSTRGRTGETEAAPDRAEPVVFKGLGFTATPLNSEAKADFGTQTGVLIEKVEGRGSAARRGLRPNTVILSVDRKSVTTPGQVRDILRSKRAGDGVLIVVKDKDGTKQAITIEVPEDNS